ncbi:MAG: 23S rRNA (uracil(1939)-C(5))-methyltransferase RlmD [Betaproteobacteria bacterium]|nr:23S rRNA (uracil(1939)-C(5))-methyltransferase RlmD [Betaproteobacteria bacterium]
MTILTAITESLDQEGRGVARVDGKAIFIEGALIGEHVSYSTYRKKPNYELAHVDSIYHSSSSRVTPRCQYFGTCGGCSMQHLDASAQVAVKQRALEDALWHIGRVRAAQILAPIHGPAWGYRHRARLAVRDVAKKGEVLVGFHEKRSSFVADMRSCEVLPRRISDLLVPLRRLVEALSVRTRLPQIELALGDRDGAPVDVLVLRLLEPLQPRDMGHITRFADLHGVQFHAQPGGPDTARPLYPAEDRLAYTLPEFGLTLPFRPTEFTQVNAAVNRVMVRRAIALLDPQPGERVGDLFCGLGNFTLPIARRGAQAIGVEGSAGLIARARANAAANGLAAATEFHAADLFEVDVGHFAAWGRLDKLLIDPPREGAIAVTKSLPVDQVRRIVYVSCNPATLARDAGVLVNTHGYRIAAAGIVNMFPHTAHVESMAVFTRN